MLFELAGIDTLEENNSLTLSDIGTKRQLKAQIHSINTKEEISWRQKCKRWLKDGDMNSSYFDRLMNAKKRKCLMTKVLSREGNNLLIKKEIVAELTAFHESLYIKDNGHRSLPQINNWDPIRSFHGKEPFDWHTVGKSDDSLKSP